MHLQQALESCYGVHSISYVAQICLLVRKDKVICALYNIRTTLQIGHNRSHWPVGVHLSPLQFLKQHRRQVEKTKVDWQKTQEISLIFIRHPALYHRSSGLSFRKFQQRRVRFCLFLVDTLQSADDSWGVGLQRSLKIKCVHQDGALVCTPARRAFAALCARCFSWTSNYS